MVGCPVLSVGKRTSAFFSTSPTAATTSRLPTAATIADRRPDLLLRPEFPATGTVFTPGVCVDSDIAPASNWPPN
jgi:hypothetical protein